METNCKNMGPRLNAYIDGELTEKDRNSLETHLESCMSCQQLFSELKETGDMIKDGISPENVPDIDLSGMWEEIEAQVNFGPTAWQRLRALVGRPMVWLPTAVATAAVAVLVFLLPVQQHQPQASFSQVESVYSQTGQVMVMQTAKSGQPLIWILPEPKQEKEEEHEI